MISKVAVAIVVCAILYSSSVSAGDPGPLYKWLRDAKPSAWVLTHLYLDSLAQRDLWSVGCNVAAVVHFSSAS